MARFWNFIKNAATETTPESIELRIEGDIVSNDDAWIYEWFGIQAASPNAFRNELAQYNGKDITVWIDSYGGDVFAGAGIYNALKEHNGKVTAKITKAMSAASVPAMAADEVLMAPGGIIMMHNPLTSAHGYASDMRKTADVLDTVKETIMNAYQMKTGKSREEISQMMNDETYLSANMAVKEGFADGILYQENLSGSQNIMNFAFNRMSIQNSANAALKHFMEIGAQNLNSANNETLNKEEEKSNMEIKNVEDLKKVYPELVNQIENNAKTIAENAERERLKAIDEISNNLDPELVNKAKYVEPMNAEKLAFQAIKNDAKKGEQFLNTRKEEIENSGAAAVSTENNDLDGDKENEAVVVNSLANFMNKKRGGVK